MKKDDLIKYLEYITDVEKNIYFLDCSIEELQNRKQNLGNPRVYAEPTKPVAPKLEKTKSWIWYIVFGITLIVIAVLIGADDGMIFISVWPFLAGIVSFIGLLVEVPAAIKAKKVNAERLFNYEVNMEKYDKELSIYLKNEKTDRVRVMKELTEVETINKWINKFNDQKKESQKRLKELYSYNIIYPKYRNLVAVSSFLDYFSAGLCYAFEAPENGVGGAYYIFENEMLHKQIIMELKEINENLNKIKASQYSLYCAVAGSQEMLSELNATMKMIADEGEKGNRNVEKLIEESRISNYYAQQTQRELSYLNNMQYLSGNYDIVNPFFRTPPT